MIKAPRVAGRSPGLYADANLGGTDYRTPKRSRRRLRAEEPG
jgi:hypothetical protein